MKTSFTTTLIQAEGKNATGINVPAEAVQELGGGKKPPVKVTFSGYTYRTTIAAYGDVFMLPVSQEHRENAGVHAGDELHVTLELDTEPRTVTIPDDLLSALSADPAVLARFEKLAPSARKEHVRQVESAKAQDTRERRIIAIVTKLTE